MTPSDLIPGEMGNTRKQGEDVSNFNQADLSGRSYDNIQDTDRSESQNDELDETDAMRERSGNFSLPPAAGIVERTQPTGHPNMREQTLESINRMRQELNIIERMETNHGASVHSSPQQAGPAPVPAQPSSYPNSRGNDCTDGATLDQIDEIFDRNSDGRGRLKILNNKDIDVLESFRKEQKLDEGGFGSVYPCKQFIFTLFNANIFFL